MRKGGTGNRVRFEGDSYLSVRYCEQRRAEGELCVGTVAWQGDTMMVSGQRVVCVQVPTNNWQSVGRRVEFTTSVVHACQLVVRCHSLSTVTTAVVSTEIGQSGTN